MFLKKLEEERRLEEEYDEKVRLERIKREEEERERAREERLKQREAMKESRAKRLAEREFSHETIALRQEQKEKAVRTFLFESSDSIAIRLLRESCAFYFTIIHFNFILYFRLVNVLIE